MYQFPESIKQLYTIYSPDFPEFLTPFINAPEMQRLGGVGQCCGMNFTSFFNYDFFLSRLDHSVGVALIIWNFTKDKKQALAGLFHDISHTAFSHVGDFLRGDTVKQESSEVFHDEIIGNSQVIMSELQKLGISFEEINDYTIYPIADNDGPQLSSDRLEYNFCDPVSRGSNDENIKTMYGDLIILINEHGQQELGFQHKHIAKKFADLAIDNDAQMFSSYESKLCMSFLSDLFKQAIDVGLFSLKDLYKLTDQEVFDVLERSGNNQIINKLQHFRNLQYYKVRIQKPTIDNYCVDTKIKKRYIDPLVQQVDGIKRLSQLDEGFKTRAYFHKNKSVERVSIDYKVTKEFLSAKPN